MSNVLGMDKQQILNSFFRLGWSNRRIHRETGIHRQTIKKYRKHFQSVPEVLTGNGQPSGQNVPEVLTDLPPTNSIQLQPHLERIHEKAGLGLSAQRIYQDLVEEADYQGGYYSVQRYVRKLKKTSPKHYERLPVEPGLEAQIDFGKGAPVLKNGRYVKAWLFKMTLSFSSHSYEEQVWDQKVETFIRCHEHAFESFGGVPKRIKLDNLKSGVLLASLYDPVINPRYQAFAEHCGFVPDPCIPRAPEHKGRVERDIRYTVDNALKARRFESLDASNAHLRRWNRTWARTRIHGSKKAQVWRLFTECERPALQDVPETSFAMFEIGTRKVDVTGHIEVLGNFYSVPHRYMGRRVVVHFNQQYIKVIDGMDVVTCHTPRTGRGMVATAPGHKPSYKPRSQEQAEHRLCEQARQAGPSCHRLVYMILSGSDSNPLAVRQCRGILELGRKHPDTIEDACRESLQRGVYRYQAIKKWCEASPAGHTGPVLTQEHDLIRTMHEYQTVIDERS